MKYDAKKHLVAVVQNGLALYGIGKTRDEAVRDAAEWIEPKNGMQGDATVADVEKLIHESRGFHGDFYVITDGSEIKKYVSNV